MPEGDTIHRAAAALRAQPARVTRWNARRLRHESVVVTPRAFAEASWAMLYDAGRARALFGLAHRAASGDWAPWVDAAVRRGQEVPGAPKGPSQEELLTDIRNLLATGRSDVAPGDAGTPPTGPTVGPTAGPAA